MRMKLAIFFISIGILSSCKKPEDRACFKSAGDDIEVNFQLDEFKHLDCFGNYKLNLIQDTVNKIVLKGGENLVSMINWELREDSLFINDENKCRFLRSYDKKVTVDLHYKNIDYILYIGSDTIRFLNPMVGSYLRFRMRESGGSAFLNLDCDYVDISMESGSCDLNVTGQSVFARIFIQSMTQGFCEEFETQDMLAINNGNGDLYVNPGLGILKATVSHIGNIYYKGNPSPITLDKTGSGDLIQLEE